MDELTFGIAALERAPLFAGLDREDLKGILGCRQVETRTSDIFALPSPSPVRAPG
jgi:hypothetical protein